MLRVPELEELLSPELTVYEDEDHVVIFCRSCGHNLVYHCGRFDVGRARADAENHLRACRQNRGRA